MVHVEALPDRSTALAREKYIKNLGSRKYLGLINNDSQTNNSVE